MSQQTKSASSVREVTGLHRMTVKGIKDLCKRHQLYQTPRLNDMLYLHYQGYQCIECLDEYTNLKCLWLECNAISEIQGLDNLGKLKCLFLQNNLVTKIENLGSCPELDTLNLSSNHIRKIENIGTDILPVLNTLNIASNYLKDSESLSDLIHCKTLSVLDLSNNRIDDILIVKIFEQMESLKVLVLQGNPVVSRLPQYRKTLILACKHLTYLDSRPVFDRDRACAEAWKRDGYEGERKENNRWNRADRKKIRDSVNCTIRMRNRYRPADQQDPLIGSSDSEDERKGDACAEKSRKKAELENGAVDDLWDEVSGRQHESDGKSSSCSTDNESVGSNADHIAEQSSNRRPLEGRPKFLYDTEVTQDNEKIIQSEELPIKDAKQEKRIIIQEANLQEKEASLDTKEECLEQEASLDTKMESSEQQAGLDTKVESLKHQDTVETSVTQSDEQVQSSDSELETDGLDQICKALNSMSLNGADSLRDEDLEPGDLRNRLVERMYKSYETEMNEDQNDDFDASHYEGEPNCGEPKFNNEYKKDKAREPFSTEDDVKELQSHDSCELKPKTMEQLVYEMDCALANEKCSHDLQEMASQLEEDLDEIRQCSHSCDAPADDPTDQSDSEIDEETLKAQMDARSPILAEKFNERRKLFAERQKDVYECFINPNEETNNEDTNNDETSKEETEPNDHEHLFAKLLDFSSDNVPKRVFGEGLDVPNQDWPHEECLRQLPLAENKNFPEPDDVFTRPIDKTTSFEAAEEICRGLDQKLSANDEELRKLLQELEDDVNSKYNIETKVEYEQTVTTDESDVASICQALLDNIIGSLNIDKKPKSFEFEAFESDDEYNYSVEPNLPKLVPPELEDPARGKSIRECIDTFTDFISEMKDSSKPLLLGREPTSGVEKIRAAQELLKSKNLSEFNKDTKESLDAQIAKETQKFKRHVAHTATRCFAQRDKYDDTLEVVDDRLMVVKKDTGELEELPPPPALISDSESDDYNTAEEEEAFGGDKFRRPWTTPYQPKPRKSEEHLVTEALQRYGYAQPPEESPRDEKESEPVPEEFHSLEAMTTFGNLDSEFFQKLDLEKLDPKNDEADAAIKCMRSYNELAACMKSGSREMTFTNEEMVMLQSIQSNNSSESDKAKPVNPKEEEEDELLKKMVIRMKEYEERERQLQLLPPPSSAELPLPIPPANTEESPPVIPPENTEELPPVNLSIGGFTIFEQKSQIVEADTEESKDLEAEEPQDIETESLKDVETEVSKDDPKPKENPEENHGEKKEVPNEEKVDSLIQNSIPKTSRDNNIDDDIQSDVGTDYESDVEVAVVEPPNLPESVLKSLYSEEFRADIKRVQEREEATRRSLLGLQQMRAPRSPTNTSLPPQEKPVKAVTSEAQAKWAKISERLREFLDPEEMAKLNENEFGESDGDEDEGPLEIILENSDEGEEKPIDVTPSVLEDIKIIDLEENPERSNDEPINDIDKTQDKPDDSKTVKIDYVVESNPIEPESGTINLNPVESEAVDGNLKNLEDNGDDTKLAENIEIKPVIIDYMVAPDATDPESDTVNSDPVKSEEIDCNLEILDENGDVIGNGMSVAAHVTYK
ncbi:hypothetical protein KR018_002892 [Drosophila ironensis]|nr:hypothetical protein KR018_002892 [Drosophila ironensis]